MGKKKRLKLERMEKQRMVAKTERPPISKGIVLFGVLLVLSSLVHMHKLVADRQAYADYYGYLPTGWILARYAFSWLQRFAGILAGIGILARKEIARKLAFIIGGFTLATVYWKHPYPAVKLHCEYLDKQFGYFLPQAWTGISFSSLAPLSVAALILCDIVFWGIFFYCFTRPSVKDQFKSVA